jgi:uncharacterized protein
MRAPDVNVLVAAFRADHPHHTPARAWLTAELARCATGGQLALLPMVCTSFVRLVTHHRVFAVPATTTEAFDFLDSILRIPGCTLVNLSPEWPLFAALCRGKALSGNLVQDAWIAAAARANGAVLATFDRDFAGLLAPHELEQLVATVPAP